MVQLLNIIGVICEFNPFHNGHKFLLDSIKKSFPECLAVAIMSGNFVQRGDTAIIDKFTRAKQALVNGFDLVVELPVAYAVSSAEIFAKAGVKIAEALCCDTLAFGSESEVAVLKKIADLHFNDEFNECIKSELKKGKNYPMALQEAIVTRLENEENLDEDLLKGSNNILAIEYLKALKGTNIKPFAIKRQGVSHDSEIKNEEFASASAIRTMLNNNLNDAFDFMPKNATKKDFKNLANINNLEKPISYKLRTMSKEDFTNLPDVSEGLENRIFEAVRSCCTIEELLNTIKTKRYTHARLRRILIYAILGINKEIQRTTVPYVRVLGFNNKGSEVLKESKKAKLLPIITKVSKSIKELSQKDKVILEKDILASDIWALAQNSPGKCGMDFYREIVKINSDIEI